MRILHITDTFNICCGRSKHICQLSKHLKDIGHDVDVVAGGGDGLKLLEAEKIKYATHSEILHSARTVKNYILAIRNMHNVIKNGYYDVVHTHHPYSSSIARVTTKILGIPQIYTIHQTVHNFGKLPFYVGDKFIAVSDAVKEFSIHDAPSIRRTLTTICYGIDMQCAANEKRSETRRKYQVDSDDVLICIISRLVKHKGHEYVLWALQHIYNSGIKNFRCLIVGDGDYQSQIENIGRSLSFKVEFTGAVSDTSPYYAASDIIAIPSLGFEGLPMTMLEAGKFSKPVVASRIDGISEVVKNEKNGILVSPGDVAEIKNALMILLSDPEKRISMGQELRRDVENRFSIERMGSEILEQYNQLINASL